ncbi:hypothetical protein C5P03_15565 [Aeromonas salmonicida subsp. salmonicida 01-B526]|uniref:OLD protein-like TOPRIM domain-containing protein n=1 Tax=Aeromonas salmonicida subsp. salmonicida 01-B526 TaxID=1076135 RepID=A0ABN0E279_AERSS|nr:hypothetical protein C5P03_15565 [Aeromonas salmonicida subsp. salmonicida 01-B526]EHI53309.1 hypothetical protein IYQ_06496 [Aeromonas salmonicida subsp. salmonicida 01-B526]
MILVEGESEEIFIPIIAFRLAADFKGKKIKIYNSKSKQKLLSDFLSFKEKYPKLKIVCLLDSDAKKEKNDIERVISNNLHKYRLIYIKKGAFEDAFDIDTSISVINEMYPLGSLIVKEDIDQTKDFAKKIAFCIGIDKIPSEIQEIIDLGMLLTRESIFTPKDEI